MQETSLFQDIKSASDFISRYSSPGQEDVLVNFAYGFVVGAAAFLLVLLIVKIVSLIFFSGQKRAKGIRIAGNNGSLFISSDAIADLIKALEANYRYLDISKVSLYDRNKFYAIEIQVNYDLDGGDLPLMASEFQAMTLSKLNSVFGIDCVKEVNLHVKRSSKTRNSRF